MSRPSRWRATSRQPRGTRSGRRSFTGKPCRLLKNDWTDAWEAPGNPKPLGMPLQMMVAIECISRGHAYPRGGPRRELQPGGADHRPGSSVRRTKDVVLEMVEEYIDTVETLQQVNEGATA